MKELPDDETSDEAADAPPGSFVPPSSTPCPKTRRLGGGQPCVIRTAVNRTLEATPVPLAVPDTARRRISLGSIALSSNLFLSPLAGYTDLAFRRIVRSCGGVGLATTEVVSSRAILHASKKTPQYLRTTPDDRPLAVQIDGANATDLSEAARLLEQWGHAAIDINMGCPVPKIALNGGGASWTCDPCKAASAVAATVAAVKIPVTVKMRLGWDDSSITAPELARACEEAGAAAIFVHGRTRAQGFSGEVRRPGIAAVVAAVKSIPVVGNGDVVSTESAARMFIETGCGGVSIGRAALTDPWIFARIRALIDGTPPPEPTFEDRVALIRRHWDLLLEQDGEERAAVRFRKAAIWYGPAIRASREYKRRVGTARTRACVESIIDDVLSGTLRARPRGRHDAEPQVRVPSGPISQW